LSSLVPVCVGVKVTLIVQLLAAAELAVQVIAETAKSPFVVVVMLVSATVCWFLYLASPNVSEASHTAMCGNQGRFSIRCLGKIVVVIS